MELKDNSYDCAKQEHLSFIYNSRLIDYVIYSICSITFKTTGLWSLTGFKYLPYHFRDVSVWASYLTAPCLDFLICQIGVNNSTNFQTAVWWLNEIIYVRCVYILLVTYCYIFMVSSNSTSILLLLLSIIFKITYFPDYKIDVCFIVEKLNNFLKGKENHI